MKKLISILMLAALVATASINPLTTMAQTPAAATGDVEVDITTTVGDIRIKLYGNTPRHRDNFLKLVGEGFYDGVLFHRVISQFMIQTGDPDSKGAPAGKMLGSGDPGYTLEAEIRCPEYFHRRGALAAARTGDEVNPERRSSGSQFYIVTGRKFAPAQLEQVEQRVQNQEMQAHFNELAMQHRDSIIAMQTAGDEAGLRALQAELVAQTEKWGADHAFHFTPEQVDAYTTMGGAPHLDGQYTVFGEVISGWDAIEKIEAAQTDSNDRPVDDIRIISMKVVK